MGACHRAPKQVTALAVHGPRKACGRAGRGLDRRRGAAALGSRPSARPGEGRSTGCLSPLPSLFHLRPRPQGPGPIALVEQDAHDGQRRRTRPPYQTGHKACAADGGLVPRGRAARPGPGARGSHSAPGRRLPSPQTLLMSERRDRPRWGRAGRVRPQGACQASVRPRAAAGRGARRGPPMGGSRDSSLLRRPVLRGTPHCGIQGASDARRWETGRPGEEAAGEPRGQPRGPQALPPPSAPEPGVGRPRWRFPQAARATPAHAARHLLCGEGALAPRPCPRCPELRSAPCVWTSASLSAATDFSKSPAPPPTPDQAPHPRAPRGRPVARPASAGGLAGGFPLSDAHALRCRHTEPGPYTVPSNSLRPTPDECHGAFSL